jgi:CubicO group peptidase (beta-lactamase class C family)
MRRILVAAWLVACTQTPHAVTPAGPPPRASNRSEPAALLTAGPDPALADFDALVARSMSDWNIPGLAIAIVKDGKLIASRGYGLRDVAKRLPVTTKTRFDIASITKSFTASAIASLVDEKQLDWDTPVRAYWQDFELSDAVATQQITLRDMLSHRSGLAVHDLMLSGHPSFTRDELVHRLRYLAFDRPFRTSYEYNNIMVAAAGIVAARRVGKSWEDLVRARVLGPLGMTATGFYPERGSEPARGYSISAGAPKEVDYQDQHIDCPAGCINSTVEDMARFATFLLDEGRFGGKQIVTAASMRELKKPHVFLDDDRMRFPEMIQRSYGLGLGILAYRGRELVQHFGAVYGFTSHLVFLPAERIAIVALTNADLKHGVPFLITVDFTALDQLLAASAPWRERLLEKKNESPPADPAMPQVPPSHALAEYAGVYEDPGYGELRIALFGSELAMTYNNVTSPLRHVAYEIFEARADPFTGMRLSFTTGFDGTISEAHTPGAGNLIISFRRKRK